MGARVRSAAGALAVVAVLSLGGAGSAAADRLTRTVPLPASRALTVAITVGTLEVRGWERADAEFTITRHAPDAAGVERMPVRIEETDALVRCDLTQEGDTSPHHRTDLRLRVPRRARLSDVRIVEGRLRVEDFDGAITADLRRGPIDAARVSGALRFETGIGDVDVTEARLLPSSLLRLRAFNGDVRLHLAGLPTDARLMALALNGTITSDIPLAMKDAWGPRWGEATLGRGEPVVSIDVVTGDIEIRVTR
ncbi:MAG: hypothetical protein AB1635_05650 [Acidobacteriota bacterium]